MTVDIEGVTLHLGHPDEGQSRDGHPVRRLAQSEWDASAGDLPESLARQTERRDAAGSRLGHPDAGRWDAHAE